MTSVVTGGTFAVVTFAVHEAPAHTHSFTYSAEGATITATCDEEGCDLPESSAGAGEHVATLTIAAEGGTYDGATAYGATITDDNGIQGDAKVQYQKKTDGSYGAATEAAPTDAGDYMASITVGGATASVEYTINQAATSITAVPNAGGITYGQTLADSALAGGAGSVEGAFAWADDTIAPEVADSDSTEYDVVFTPSDANYAAAACKVTLTVDRAASAVAEAPTAKASAYTGSAQELVSAGRATGGEMRYAIGTEAGATGPYAASVPAATEVGAYHVWYKVAGDDNHEDSEPASVAASIGRADISGAEVTLARASYAYDGKAKEPRAKVTLGGVALRAGRDFSVSYKGNVKVGTATATVTGQGNYQGTAKTTFKIALLKVRGLSTAAHAAKGTLDASWNAVAGAASYQLSWRKDGGKWKTMTVKGTSATVEGLKAGDCYEVRVRATAGSAAGAWSKVACRWLRKASSIKAVAGKSAGTIKVSWATDEASTGGYVAYACEAKDGKVLAKKSVAAGRTSATLKGLESGRAYYVKVRPLRESSGTTYVGVVRYCKATVRAN